jgi:AcrR family transcriptional regulator
MGRLSNVRDDVVFAAVARRMAGHGSVSLQNLVDDIGISFGSLYHRYGSREGLLARVWLDAVQEFQRGFLAALTSGGANAGESAALETPGFCRREFDRALILVTCRRSEFMTAELPRPLREEVEKIDDQAADSMAKFASERRLKEADCWMAIAGFPIGAVRLYLPLRPVPSAVDDYVRKGYRALING